VIPFTRPVNWTSPRRRRGATAPLAVTTLSLACALFSGSFLATSASGAPVSSTTADCTIANFSVSARQSGGGAGTVHTDVSMVNVGPSCRLTPMRARGYSLVTHSFVGAASYIAQPIVTPEDSFPYTTTHLLGIANHAEQVSLDLGYTDVAIGQRNCGSEANATAVAFWMLGQPDQIKVARVPMGGSTTFATCSSRQYFFLYWPSTGSFQPDA
jgi:hypothetical protein